MMRDIESDPDFLDMLAHELRSPLATIIGCGELLQRVGSELLEEQRHQVVEDICNEADRLRLLVDDLMTIAGASGRQHIELAFEVVDVREIARRVARRYLHRHPNSSIQIDSRTGATLVVGIPGFVEEMLDNLIGNALKYSGWDEAVDVMIVSSRQNVQVHVLDRGVGIEPGDEKRVFVAHYRSGRASKVAPGNGIGLAVCKRLATTQGGRVWARARPGGGSDVGFSLRTAAQV
jgi:two-component system sensor histidine kinase MprB